MAPVNVTATAPATKPSTEAPPAESPITPSTTAEVLAPITAPVAAIKTPEPSALVEGPSTSQPVGGPLALEYAVPVPYRRPSVNDIIASLNGSTTTTSPPPEAANGTAPVTEATPIQQVICYVQIYFLEQLISPHHNNSFCVFNGLVKSHSRTCRKI